MQCVPSGQVPAPVALPQMMVVLVSGLMIQWDSLFIHCDHRLSSLGLQVLLWFQDQDMLNCGYAQG